jgi:tRNA-dihydrouridine synthase A
LKYDTAYRLKKDFPHLNIILNGGLKTIEDIQKAMPHVDGVMIGREAYSNPWFMAEIERDIFGTAMTPTRLEVVEKMIPYIDRCLTQGAALKDITRHILGLWQGLPGARRWRRILSEEAYKPGANSNVVHMALREVVRGE